MKNGFTRHALNVTSFYFLCVFGVCKCFHLVCFVCVCEYIIWYVFVRENVLFVCVCVLLREYIICLRTCMSECLCVCPVLAWYSPQFVSLFCFSSYSS